MNDADNAIKTLLETTKIEELMNTSVKTVEQNDDLDKVVEIFSTFGIYCIPVVDDKNKLVGLVSHKYVYKAQAPRKLLSNMDGQPWIVMDINAYYEKATINSYILKNLMYKNPPSLKKEDPLSEAVNMILTKKLAGIPIVTSDNTVCGLLTSENIIELISRPLANK